jgi:hypothetical protein
LENGACPNIFISEQAGPCLSRDKLWLLSISESILSHFNGKKRKRIVARFKEIVWQFHQCHLISSSTVQQISSSELGAECWFCDVADSVIGKE